MYASYSCDTFIKSILKALISSNLYVYTKSYSRLKKN